MRGIVVAAVFLSGFFLPVQVAVNSRLSEGLGSPVRSSIVSFLVGLAALFIVYATFDAKIGQMTQIAKAPTWQGGLSVPIWAYLGGLCGAFYVLVSIVALPRLGAVATIALALMGQQVASLAIDSFGLFGAPKLPMTMARVFGALLVVAGVLMVQSKK